MIAPIAETELMYVRDQHARRYYLDVQGYTVRPHHFTVNTYVGAGGTPVVLDSGICWAASVAEARKLLGKELRSRPEWRGCDGRIVE